MACCLASDDDVLLGSDDGVFLGSENRMLLVSGDRALLGFFSPFDCARHVCAPRHLHLHRSITTIFERFSFAHKSIGVMTRGHDEKGSAGGGGDGGAMAWWHID